MDSTFKLIDLKFMFFIKLIKKMSNIRKWNILMDIFNKKNIKESVLKSDIFYKINGK